MSEQNIYDNQTFFDGYKKLRENSASANVLVEKPALFSLSPNLNGKTVLDLGCGYGENCFTFSKAGAKKVVGLDIAEKMLGIAKEENAAPNISYINMSMTKLQTIDEKFDVIFSSLAAHYIEDFDKLARDVYNLLNDGGCFIFSQEHPLTTALIAPTYWTKNETDEYIHYNLTTYSLEGERKVMWFVDNVIIYHRTMSSILNALSSAGFVINKVIEPIPSETVMEKHPAYKKYLHKPDFLLIKVEKQNYVK